MFVWLTPKAKPPGAEAHFDKALADPAGDTWPFERDQLQLLLSFGDADRKSGFARAATATAS